MLPNTWLTSNRKVQSLRGHESRVNAGLCFIAVDSWSPLCSFSDTAINTSQRGPDIVSAGRILEQNQVFRCPDTELPWTKQNMPSSIFHHYFKLLWLIGDTFLLSIITCSVFSISCSKDLMVEPKIPTEHQITMQEWWKHTWLSGSTAFSYFYILFF